MGLSLRLPKGGNGETVHDPLSMYKISDMDDASNPQYYGNLAHDGSWYIMKVNTTDKTYRYQVGVDGYSTAWTNRASLGYDYFDAIF